ncbi:MAG: DUF4173 domain-containing protein, partial [Patescibacteria group bacterium]|nr:DUF4173 domain-containing protein [Patescibacteria group bacterium]
LVLPPLVTCEDPIIREGIRAMLAERYLEAEGKTLRRSRRGWTAHQVADEWLVSHLAALRPYWEPYTDPEKRQEALARFRAYAYQWY